MPVIAMNQEMGSQGKFVAEKLAEEIILIHRGRVVLDGSLAGIRASSGNHAVHVEFEGEGAFLTSLPDVTGGRVDTNRAELVLAAGSDAQAILREAASRLKVRRFEVVEPSLEEIFIEKVGESTLAPEGTAAA